MECIKEVERWYLAAKEGLSMEGERVKEMWDQGLCERKFFTSYFSLFSHHLCVCVCVK